MKITEKGALIFNIKMLGTCAPVKCLQKLYDKKCTTANSA